MVLGWDDCKGTLVVVPMQVNIHTSTSNQGGNGDAGTQGVVGHSA
jgi:hypothetical protein